MKLFNLTLEPLSPFIAGQKKLGNNLNRSLPYIPGSVIRSAIALQLLNQCPYFDEISPTKNKRFWVEFNGGELCSACRWADVCRNFSAITVGNAYPMASRPYPLTAMKCKYDKTHSSADMLINDIHRTTGDEYAQLAMRCPQCKERMERCSGFYLMTDSVKEKIVSQRKQLIIKGGINHATKTNTDGRLYALEAVTPAGHVAWNDGVSSKSEVIDPMKYEARIVMPDGMAFPSLTTLHVGAESHSGFGVMKAELAAFDHKSNLSNRIKEFNTVLNTNGETYIALTALSPLLLGLEDGFDDNDKPSAISQKDFNAHIESAFNDYLHNTIGCSINLVMSFAEYEWLRGFDTSMPASTPGHLRKARLYAVMGSVYVFKAPAVSDNLIAGLQVAEQEGIGLRTKDGYGTVSICDKYHIQNNAEEVLRHDR